MGGLPTKRPAVAFTADPTTSPVMFVAFPDGLWKSGDSGKTWQQLAQAPGGITALAINLEKREVVFAGTGDGKLFRSSDGGTSWQAAP